MLRQSVRQTLRNVAALRQLSAVSTGGRTTQSTASSSPAHHHALLSVTQQYADQILSNTYSNRRMRMGIRGLSLRSFSTASRRESITHSEDESDTITDSSESETPETATQDAPSESSQTDDTRQILRSVLQRTNAKQKASADRPFVKKSIDLKPDPKQDWPVHRDLHPHIRACLPDVQFESREMGMRDTGLSVCLLGTGAGVGSRLRANSATVVRHDGQAYLVDAGEGVSKQFLQSRVGTAAVRKIFITHMHGDHVFGLPGLLLNLQLSGIHAGERRKIEIFGPVGLYNYIAMAVSLCGTELRRVEVIVYELHGGTQRSMRDAGNRKHYKDFQHRGLHRKTIQQNQDGTWTLAEAMELDTPEKALAHSTPSGMTIKAAEIHHVPQMQCFGYTFEEPQIQVRKILNPEELRSLGLDRHGFRLLKAGFPVWTPDKTKQIHPDEVCGKASKPRKVTVLGDCCMVPPVMEQLAYNSDALVHEATLSVNDKGNKAIAGGHSTAAQAGSFADHVRAKVLLMNHVSLKVDVVRDSSAGGGSNQSAIDHMAEAERRIRGLTRVQLAYDHMEFMIPRRGDWGFQTYDPDEEEPAVQNHLEEQPPNRECTSEGASSRT